MNGNKNFPTVVDDTVTALMTAGVGLAIAGPIGAILGAVGSPAATAALGRGAEKVRSRRAATAGAVLEMAAKFAGIGLDQLSERFEGTPDRQELFCARFG